MITDDRRRIVEHIQEQRWLGNIPKQFAGIVSQAASTTGFNVYTGEARRCPANYRTTHVGVYACDPTLNHSPFWAEYRRLKAEME